MKIQFEDGSIFDSETGLILEPPRVAIFEVSRGEVEPFSKVVVRWRVRNAELIWLNNRVVDELGERVFEVHNPTVFRIFAKNAVGETGEVLVVNMKPGTPVVSFTADAKVLSGNRPLRLSWMVGNAQEVFLNDEPVPSSDSREILLHQSTTFRLVARNEHGETTRTIEASVRPRKPTIHLFASSSNVCAVGEEIELSWRVHGAYRLHLDGAGDVTGKRRLRVRLRSEGEHRFRLVAQNYFGKASEAILVVNAVPPSLLMKARRFFENWIFERANRS